MYHLVMYHVPFMYHWAIEPLDRSWQNDSMTK